MPAVEVIGNDSFKQIPELAAIHGPPLSSSYPVSSLKGDFFFFAGGRRERSLATTYHDTGSLGRNSFWRNGQLMAPCSFGTLANFMQVS